MVTFQWLGAREGLRWWHHTNTHTHTHTHTYFQLSRNNDLRMKEWNLIAAKTPQEFLTGEWKVSDPVCVTVSVYSLSVCVCLCVWVCLCPRSYRMCGHFSYVDSFMWTPTEITSVSLSFCCFSPCFSSAVSFPPKAHSSGSNTSKEGLSIYWNHPNTFLIKLLCLLLMHLILTGWAPADIQYLFIFIIRLITTNYSVWQSK